jgi:nucleosome binding factor SPN SPT16 subunit
MAAKYFEMNCHVGRTLLINPTEETGKNYQALYFLHQELIKELK